MPDSSPRLFLVTPIATDPASFREPLRQAIEAGKGAVACVLARHDARDERGAKTLLRELAALVQPSGAALLAEDDPRLVAHADLDGVHIAALGDSLGDAIERLKPERIVGCGGFSTRHDAMTAGETDLDYLMFGEPDRQGHGPSPAETLEWVSWWAEIFSIPCVGFAQTLADVAPLAAAGADFIALGEAVWSDPRGPAAAVGEAIAAIRTAALPHDKVQA